MDSFDYSLDFQKLIVDFHRGQESLPDYMEYIEEHLGGPSSRFVRFFEYLCPEMEFHCGELEDKRILDIGCGTGSSTAALAYFCRDVVAFDICLESLNICKSRIAEHDLLDRVEFVHADAFDVIRGSIGKFDIVLANGVIEHIPLTLPGLRRKLINDLFAQLEKPGYLYISDTPNRLYPFDFHTTHLWWLPWLKPSSHLAYKIALNRGRWLREQSIAKGAISLEEAGVWGSTYFEILNYLRGKRFLCVNTLEGHNRRLEFSSRGSWKRSIFEFVTYHVGVRILKIPITALAPFLAHLVIMKY